MYNDDDYNNYLDREEWKRQEQEYNDYQNRLFYEEEQARYNSQDSCSSYNGGSFGGGSLFGGHCSGPLVRAADAFGEVVFMYVFGFVSLFLASLGSVIWPIIGLFVAFGTIVYDRDKSSGVLSELLCFLLSIGARLIGLVALFSNISILWQHFFG